MIFVHNSYDGRELFEELDTFINNKNMNTEKKKLDTAMNVVANSIMHGWTADAKISYVTQILPNHYIVTESIKKGDINCKSKIGIDDDEQWEYFIKAIKHRFKDFSEIFHNVCTNHIDFTIHFKGSEV